MNCPNWTDIASRLLTEVGIKKPQRSGQECFVLDLTEGQGNIKGHILIVTSCSQTDNTATDLTRITEDYGLQAAGGLTKENDKQIWLKENIGIYSSTRKHIKIA